MSATRRCSRSFWNALGGIVWATGAALGVYFLGHVAEDVIRIAGPIAAGLFVGALVSLLVWRHRSAKARPAA